MHQAPQFHRRGMTLIELLVVITILGLLSVVVLPNLSDSIESRRFLEASRSLSSFIARAQSRAINSADPRGFMLQPLAADPDASIDIYVANSPEPYGGEFSTSRARVPPQTTPITPGLTPPPEVNFLDATDTRLRIDPDFCVTGDAIQFGGSGPEFLLQKPDDISQPFRIDMWNDANHNPRNASWPRTDQTVGDTFRIRRQPRRASSGLLQLQKGASVDLTASTLGSRVLGDATSPLLDPAARSAPVTVLFDVAGKPYELVHSGGRRTRLTEPLFLLIGSSEAAGNAASSTAQSIPNDPKADRTAANWQYPDAVWLCIDNTTGIAKYAPVKPNALNILDSQYYIRKAIGLGVAEQ